MRQIPRGCLTVVLASCALLRLGCGGWQPTMRVTGTVSDSLTGKPIAGATVSDDGYGKQPYRGAVTDSAGRYSYYTWPEEHNIKAWIAGYRPGCRTLITGFLGRDTLKLADFRLVPE